MEQSDPKTKSLSVTPIMVLQARRRVEGRILHTPLEPSIRLRQITNASVFIKWESMQRTGVFKIRGALNKIASLPKKIAQRGVVTASTGNHGLAVAYAAQIHGIMATVVVPQGASPLKLDKCKRYGAKIIEYGANYDESATYSTEYAEKNDATLIHAYADPLVIAGQGTIGYEVLEDLPELDLLLVPIGGGGLISGISLWVKTVNPNVQVIGIQTTTARAFFENFKAKRLFHVPIEPTIADGLAGNTAQLNLDIAQRYVDDVILIEETALMKAIRWTIENEGRVLEPAGVVGIAALLQKKLSLDSEEHVAIIASGSNIDPTLLQTILSKKPQDQC